MLKNLNLSYMPSGSIITIKTKLLAMTYNYIVHSWVQKLQGGLQ
jgi:hypothetical protein